MNVKQIIRKFFLFCGMMVFTFLMISDSSYASETDTNQTDGDEETNRAESEEKEWVSPPMELTPEAVRKVLGQDVGLLNAEQVRLLKEAGYDVSGFEGNSTQNDYGIMMFSDAFDYPAVLLPDKGYLSWGTTDADKLYLFGGNSYWGDGQYVQAYTVHRRGSYGGDLRDAFCLNPFSDSGNQGEVDVYALEDASMLKLMYYGYGGPGYNEEIKAIYEQLDPAYSANAHGVSEAYYVLNRAWASWQFGDTNWAHGLTQNAADTVIALQNYTAGLSSPNISEGIRLIQPEGTAAFLNDAGRYQSPVICAEGNTEDYILFDLPENIALHDDKDNTYAGGQTVQIYGGTRFWLTADASDVNGTYKASFTTVLHKYRVIVFFGGSYQDVGWLNCYEEEQPFGTEIQIDWPEQKGSIELTKKSILPDITTDNKVYTLKDAVYTVYDEENKEVGRIVTDAMGNGKLDGLPKGHYFVCETTAPAGYRTDEKRYEVDVSSGEVSKMTVFDTPYMYPVDILIHKVDSETGKAGYKKMEGAEIKVCYYDCLSDSDPALEGKTPVRTWIMTTDALGEVKLDEAHKLSGDNFYYDNSVPAIAVIPEGTLTIQEISPPAGYLINPSVFIRKFSHTEDREVLLSNIPVIEEDVHKVKIILTKKIYAEDINFSNGNPMFIFKVEGKDVRGQTRTCFKILDFTQEYVNSHRDDKGQVSMEVVFDSLIAGEYRAGEMSVSRYRLENITDIENGVREDDEVLFDLKNTDHTEGRAVFINRNYEQRNYSDTQKVINRLEQ